MLLVEVPRRCVGRHTNRHQFTLESNLVNADVNHAVACGIYQSLSLHKQLELLHTLLFVGVEVLLMSIAKTCEQAYRGTDDGGQSSHFARFADGSLEHSDLGLLAHVPHAQRYTNLTVVAARRTGYDVVG